MSSTTRFVPSSEGPRPASRATFVANSSNPLHKQSSASEAFRVPGPGTGDKQPSGIARLGRNKDSKQENEGRGKPGLATATRPGTADPLNPNRVGHTADQIPVLAPVPQKAARPSAALFSVENILGGSNDPPSNLARRPSTTRPDHGAGMAPGIPNHLAGSDRVSYSNRPSLNGPRRVLVAENQAPVQQMGNRAIGSSTMNDASRKRQRDPDESLDDGSPQHPPMKRFRVPEAEVARTSSSRHSFSPQLDRPSSGMSSNAHSFRNQASPGASEMGSLSMRGDLSGPSPRFQSEDVPRAGMDEFQPSPGGASIPDVGALDKLFNRDCNAFTAEREQAYNQNFTRWCECSFDEWISGADEIAAKLTKLIELNKKQIQEHLKKCAFLRGITTEHKKALGQRKQDFEFAKKRLIEDSLSFS